MEVGANDPRVWKALGLDSQGLMRNILTAIAAHHQQYGSKHTSGKRVETPLLDLQPNVVKCVILGATVENLLARELRRLRLAPEL